jgi:hypothetical protein
MHSFATNAVIVSYLLREKRLAFVATGAPAAASATPASEHLVAALQADLGQFGFALGGDVVAQLRGGDVDALKAFHAQLMPVAREAVGAHVKYRPLFKNFPHDVPDSLDYLVRRIIGYIESFAGAQGRNYSVLSCGHAVNHRLFDVSKFGACPVCQRQVPELSGEQAEVRPLAELTPFKLLGAASAEDVWAVFDNLARARTSLSDSSKQFMAAVVACHAEEAARRLPQQMPFKEVAAFIAGALLRHGVPGALLQRFIVTPTDVLRVAVALCDGDVSLKEVTRFKLANGQRQALMRAFEALPQKEAHVLEEMLGYRGRWLRLGEVLHVGKFARRFPKLAACFDALRNREASISTHASRVEQLLVKGDLSAPAVRDQLLNALAQRPGELARKVDALLARGLPEGEVLGALQQVAANVSTTILLTMLAHFRQRAQPAEFRAFMPKGSMAKLFIVEGDARAALPMTARLGVLEVVEAELRRRFAERTPLGRVYVDEALEGVLVPFSARSASTGLSPLTRGSRVALTEGKEFVRLFIHWKETREPTYTGTIDVDLTCGLYDGDWNRIDHLSWTNARSMGRSVHSGDVRSASGPEGAAEFIDLDRAALRHAGVRYAAMTVFSWTGQKFNTFPCFAGFMEREEPSSGHQFEAKTVKHKFAVTGEHVVAAPLVLDLVTGEVVWADMSLKGRDSYNCIENSNGRTVALFKAVLAMREQRVSLKELFELHGRARGTLVARREDADLVLDEAQMFALDEVVANWL